MSDTPSRERYIPVVATGTTVESPLNSMLARAPRNESSPGIRPPASSVAAPNRDGGVDTRATRAANKILWKKKQTKKRTSLAQRSRDVGLRILSKGKTKPMVGGGQRI